MADGRARVWYAAYGSNLHWPRLRCYLQGGRAEGGARVHAPCSDRRVPVAQAASSLPFPLFFAGESPTWGGGIAFIDPRRRDATTLARLYLLSTAQFTAVAAAEARRAHLRLPGRRAAVPGWYALAPGRYGVVVTCGQRDGIPVLSVTGPPPGAATAPPRPAYLRTLAAGLIDAHGLSPAAVADYLDGIPGVAGHYGRDELEAVADGRLPPVP